MMENFIPLIASFLPIWEEYLIYVFCMGFIAFCGCFIHSLFRR